MASKWEFFDDSGEGICINNLDRWITRGCRRNLLNKTWKEYRVYKMGELTNSNKCN